MKGQACTEECYVLVWNHLNKFCVKVLHHLNLQAQYDVLQNTPLFRTTQEPPSQMPAFQCSQYKEIAHKNPGRCDISPIVQATTHWTLGAYDSRCSPPTYTWGIFALFWAQVQPPTGKLDIIHTRLCTRLSTQAMKSREGVTGNKLIPVVVGRNWRVFSTEHKACVINLSISISQCS